MNPPVSMLSLTIALPEMSTASHVIIQPCAGTTITSPGTRCVVDTNCTSVGVYRDKETNCKTAKSQKRGVFTEEHQWNTNSSSPQDLVLHLKHFIAFWNHHKRCAQTDVKILVKDGPVISVYCTFFVLDRTLFSQSWGIIHLYFFLSGIFEYCNITQHICWRNCTHT